MFKRNYAVIAIAMVSLMLAFAPTVQTEAFLGGFLDVVNWLLNPLVILVKGLLGGVLTDVQVVTIGKCSEYKPANVTLDMLENKTWYVVKTNTSYTCFTTFITKILPGSLVPTPLPSVATDQVSSTYMESGQKFTKLFTMTTLSPGTFLAKQFPTNLTSSATVDQTLAIYIFKLLNISDTTMLAVTCPIQPTSTYHSVHIWTTDGKINPEVAEFEQQARNQSVDLSNFHALANPIC